MNNRQFGAIVGFALCGLALPSYAAVHKVHPGQSIQAAIDIAAPGDTILV